MNNIVFTLTMLLQAVNSDEAIYEWNIPESATKLLTELLFDINKSNSAPIKCRFSTSLADPIEKINRANSLRIICESSDFSQVFEIKDSDMILFGENRSKWLQLNGEITEGLFAKLKKEAWKTKSPTFDQYPVSPIVSCDVPADAPFNIYNCYESYYLSGEVRTNRSEKAILFCNRVTAPKDIDNVGSLLSHPGLDASMAMRKNLSDLIENEISFGIRAKTDFPGIRCYFIEP